MANTVLTCKRVWLKANGDSFVRMRRRRCHALPDALCGMEGNLREHRVSTRQEYVEMRQADGRTLLLTPWAPRPGVEAVELMPPIPGVMAPNRVPWGMRV